MRGGRGGVSCEHGERHGGGGEGGGGQLGVGSSGLQTGGGWRQQQQRCSTAV